MARILLYFIFLIPLLLEGLGISMVHQYIFYYYLLLPFFLYLYLSFNKTKLIFPFKASIVFTLFLIFSLISSIFFSVDKQTSFGLTLFELSAFLIFIFFYNQKKEAEKIINWQIFLGSAVFIIYFIFLNIIKTLNLHLFIPSGGYQFVYSNFGSHNHLGDFLSLAMILSLQKYFVLFLISLPFFLFSFSRSAYIAFLLTLSAFKLTNLKKMTKKIWLIFTVTGLLVMVFFILSVKDAGQSKVFKPFYIYLNQTFGLQAKDFFGERPEYFSQGLRSFYDHPFFGVGAGNFSYVSRIYQSTPHFWTETAHNIFLEILTENGIFALICFAVFIYLIFKSGFQKKSVFFLLFFFLIINFQADYTYNIFSFFVLFMTLAGVIYEEEKNIHLSSLYGMFSLALLIILEVIIASFLLVNAGYPKYALSIYPLNKDAYAPIIQDTNNKNNYQEVLKWIEGYEKIAPYDQNVVNLLSSIYEGRQDKKKLLALYEKVYIGDPFVGFPTIQKIYSLKKEIESKDKAGTFLKTVANKYNESKYIPWNYKKEIRDFCTKEKQKSFCNKIGLSPDFRKIPIFLIN